MSELALKSTGIENSNLIMLKDSSKLRKSCNLNDKNNINKNKLFLPSLNVRDLLKSDILNSFFYREGKRRSIRKIDDNFYKRLLGKENLKFSIVKENNNSINMGQKNTKNDCYKEKNIKKNPGANLRYVTQYSSKESSALPTQGNLSFQQNDKIVKIYKQDDSVIKDDKEKSLRFQRNIGDPLLLSCPSNRITEEGIKSNKTLPPIKKSKEYKNTYSILPGNNSKLIIQCMQTRESWEPSSLKISEFSNLVWTPLPSQINYKENDRFSFLQYCNHIEKHYEISNKMNLFKNLLRYAEIQEINLFEFFPLTIIFNLSGDDFIEQLNGFERFYNDFPNIMTGDSTCTKNYSEYFRINATKGNGDNQNLKLPPCTFSGKNLWLIKPVNMNRGRNITVLSNLDAIKENLNKLRTLKLFDMRSSGNETKKKRAKIEYVILQKYIENPLLYKKRKFDIRMWILFTDKEEIYVFKEGHLKATCDNYDINSSDPYIHLTNYSVQKHNQNFSKSEIGNEISFDAFQNELNKLTPPVNFSKKILPKIYNIIRMTYHCVKTKFHIPRNKKTFEIFGYDFLIDADFNPYLIEINTNPGLEISSPLIEMLVPRMIDDALRLTVDVGYPRGEKEKYKNFSPFYVNGYSSRENLWVKIRK